MPEEIINPVESAQQAEENSESQTQETAAPFNLET